LGCSGYTGDLKERAPYAKIYTDMGFQTDLLPDAEGQGWVKGGILDSVGMSERLLAMDFQFMLEKAGTKRKWSYFGVSMGGATVMGRV